jgi:hypothetical protein
MFQVLENKTSLLGFADPLWGPSVRGAVGLVKYKTDTCMKYVVKEISVFTNI